MFEQLRKPRCETTQSGSRSNGDMWHLEDGPEQQMRDRALSGNDCKKDAESNGETDPENPNPWSNKDFQPWLFGHDLFNAANRALEHVHQ